MRIGIFGGSFNPPHLGHLHLAESVHDALGLDEVWLIPSKISPHRSMAAYAPEQDRLAMCRLAAEAFPWLRAEDYELRQDQISYTYYTVEHFTDARPDDAFWLLMGSDMLESFTTWHRWQEILQRVQIAGIAREAGEYEHLLRVAENLRQYGKMEVVNVESFAVSSTKIREMVKNSQDTSCYLPEKIVQYISMRKLYAGSDADCIR
ncbi:MAG: nicotinate (nicotinamide) nucleotide adenylyltransferase [Oscillospiraceae bacterium]|nr:nicotinate (nicotinamide) nucleotide adenylyltransferase [Oscillospiraceae bacterium]